MAISAQDPILPVIPGQRFLVRSERGGSKEGVKVAIITSNASPKNNQIPKTNFCIRLLVRIPEFLG